MLKHITWIIFSLSCSLLFAQQPRHKVYQRYDVEDGLPQNLVTGIVQDHDGFIWVSTNDGLARFDGEKFMSFRHSPVDTQSVFSNHINSMIIDESNQIWLHSIQYEIGRFNPVTHDSEKINIAGLQVEHFIPRNKLNGISYSGFYGDERNFIDFHFTEENPTIRVLDTLNRKLIHFMTHDYSNGQKKIAAFVEADDGKLWVLTESTLDVSDQSWEKFKSFNLPQSLHFDIATFPFRVKLEPLNENKWALLIGNQITIFDERDDTFKIIQFEKQEDKREKNLNNTLTSRDSQGRLIFTYKEKIYRLENNETVTLLWVYPENLAIRTILVDRTNTLWVGSDPDGLYRINLLQGVFDSKPYEKSFITDVLKNEVGIQKEQLVLTEASPSKVYFYRSVFQDKSPLIIGFDTDQGTYRLLNIVGNQIVDYFDIEMGGQLSYTSEKKLMLLDYHGELLTWPDVHELKNFYTNTLHLPNINRTFNVINDFIAYDNQLWVSMGSSGVFVFEHGTLSDTVQLPGNYSSHLLLGDPKDENTLWIGSISGGLFKYDKVNRTFIKNYTTKNGLVNNTINSLVADTLGFLWMSTNLGISRFNPSLETFSHFSKADGLIESEFNRHHDLQMTDGRIAMGGTKGYTIFDPYSFLEDPSQPQVLLTNAILNGETVSLVKNEGVIKLVDKDQYKINLVYTDESLWLDVAAPIYNDPKKVKYRYKIGRKSDQWIDNGFDNRIRFSKMPYNTYEVFINASNSVGLWSPKHLQISLVVNPPFWLTWWAFFFYLLIFSGITISIWKQSRKRFKEKQIAEFNRKESNRLRELDEMKNRFFSNVTHEFRTPLTLILSPLEQALNDKSLTEKARTLLNNNYRHASQLLNLVNQLLDVAKLEANQMEVHPSVGDVTLFLNEKSSQFIDQAKHLGIQLHIDIGTTGKGYLFDQEKWDKIVSNLISNALKFTPKGGTVKISAQDYEVNEQSFVQYIIEDTGIGIDPSNIDKIFDRFYQVDDAATRRYEGTGIGMSLVKEMVELMGGTIAVKSKVGAGTTFTVKVPIVKLKEFPETMDVASIHNFKVKDEDKVEGLYHEKPLILVVEDNDELREFIKESLSVNWEVLVAANGFDAWTVIYSELPDIVISDVMMTGMSGYELCEKSKKDPLTAHITFILLTAKASQEAKIEGYESGADEYLTKPFHVNELELKLRNMLIEQHQLRRHLQEYFFPNKAGDHHVNINDVFIESLNKVIEDNLSNHHLSVDQIAQSLNMSKRTLNRKLNAILQTSTNDYLKKYRLNKSVEYLKTGITIAEVAYLSGFDIPSYFSQCFKKQFGMTPKEFVNSIE